MSANAMEVGVTPTLAPSLSRKDVMEIRGLMERAERAEAEFFYHFISMAPSAIQARLGISTARLGGAALTSVRNDVTGYWTGVLGLASMNPSPPT